MIDSIFCINQPGTRDMDIERGRGATQRSHHDFVSEFIEKFHILYSKGKSQGEGKGINGKIYQKKYTIGVLCFWKKKNHLRFI